MAKVISEVRTSVGCNGIERTGSWIDGFFLFSFSCHSKKSFLDGKFLSCLFTFNLSRVMYYANFHLASQTTDHRVADGQEVG